MSCIVRTFGVPVTLPLGNSAPKTSRRERPCRSSAETVEVSCHTVSNRSASNTSLHRTEPTRATRARSFRNRSTIIAFSARSLIEPRNRARISSSSASQRPRGAVPFIGLVATVLPSILKNSSGEAERTRYRPRSRYAE